MCTLHPLYPSKSHVIIGIYGSGTAESTGENVNEDLGLSLLVLREGEVHAELVEHEF